MAERLRKSEVDLSRYNDGPGLPQRYRDGSIGVHPPTDMPLYVRAFRLEGTITDAEDGREVPALKGWTLQLDAWTFGVKVYVRIGMDGTLKLFVEDGEDMTKLGHWEKKR
jgi:hypothetical protein